MRTNGRAFARKEFRGRLAKVVQMQLTDADINVFVNRVLHLGPGKRKEYLAQVDYLIKRMQDKINEDTGFRVKRFQKAGSLPMGTVLKPRDGYGVDADVAVYLDISEAERNEVELLHQIICRLLMAVYPTKSPDDFAVQPKTLGIHFRDSGLDIDLVPVIPVSGEQGYCWQPSSQGGKPVKTSVSGQLSFIKARRDGDPLYRTLVRLAKRWRNQHELASLRSFTIELILAHLQDQHGAASSLEDGLTRFFLYIAQTQLAEPVSFRENGGVTSYPSDPVVILDPVNSDNNVTERITVSERDEIGRAATEAWERLSAATWNNYKGETLELWRDVFGRSFTIEDD
jgi:hypothetical protein